MYVCDIHIYNMYIHSYIHTYTHIHTYIHAYIHIYILYKYHAKYIRSNKSIKVKNIKCIYEVISTYTVVESK